MTQPRDPDAIIATWLDDGPIDLPADTRRAIVVGLRTQPRARRMAILRGMPVNPLSRFLAAAAIVLAVGGLSIFVLSNRGSGPGALPTPSPAVSIAPSPSAPPTASPSADPLDTATWKTYVSSRYGFSIAHPAGWAEVPADHDWALPADADWLNTATESFKAPGGAVRVSAWSVSIHPAELLDRPTLTWIANAYCPLNTTPCDRLSSRTVAVTMDGHPGSLVQFANDTQAFFLVDGRMYVVACWRPDNDPSVTKYSGTIRLVQTYISTMHLLPGGPASAAPTSPGPS